MKNVMINYVQVDNGYNPSQGLYLFRPSFGAHDLPGTTLASSASVDSDKLSVEGDLSKGPMPKSSTQYA